MPCWWENKLVSPFLCNLEARTKSCKGVPPQGMYPQEIIKDVSKIQLNECALESFIRAECCGKKNSRHVLFEFMEQVNV